MDEKVKDGNLTSVCSGMILEALENDMIDKKAEEVIDTFHQHRRNFMREMDDATFKELDSCFKIKKEKEGIDNMGKEGVVCAIDHVAQQKEWMKSRLKLHYIESKKLNIENFKATELDHFCEFYTLVCDKFNYDTIIAHCIKIVASNHRKELHGGMDEIIFVLENYKWEFFKILISCYSEFTNTLLQNSIKNAQRSCEINITGIKES